MGRWTSEELIGETWDEDRVGMNVLRHDQDWDLGGPMVLMSDWWVRAHWGRAFDILRVEPMIHGQSWALMRKRDVELTVADVERPEEGEPREFVALRHNLRQFRRDQGAEIAELRTLLRDVTQLAADRPLRAAVKAARSLRPTRAALTAYGARRREAAWRAPAKRERTTASRAARPRQREQRGLGGEDARSRSAGP